MLASPSCIGNLKKASERKQHNNLILSSNGPVHFSNQNGSMSKTYSKTALMQKIRQTLGKQSVGSTAKPSGRDNSNNDKKKTPKRFIVKPSSERAANSSQGKGTGDDGRGKKKEELNPN